MKKNIFLIVLILTCSRLVFAQAPQGLNYQAVAYNGSGVPVTNQLLGVRLSILDGSATGTLVYQETQAPTTDNTGLFSIVIGNGTVVSGTFNTINWGNGSKWLKTEIDIAGGTSYVVMGTTQFMSVPYALYANATDPGSSSFTNPDGFSNSTMVVIPDSVNYTVPAGKNLYLPSAKGAIRVDNVFQRTGVGSVAIPMTFIGASENSVVWLQTYSMVGFLVDKKVTWLSLDLSTSSFTVPPNKQFVIVTSGAMHDNGNATPQPPGCGVNLNSVFYPGGYLILQNAILDEGTTLSTSNCNVPGYYVFINGYLKDK
ncbi:MAG: hypothetical protein QM737_03930 [Ferruginibacter sp.]